jgi:hypothetical protein
MIAVVVKREKYSLEADVASCNHYYIHGFEDCQKRLLTSNAQVEQGFAGRIFICTLSYLC